MSKESKTDKPLELSIAVKGEVITSNFEAYKAYAVSQIEAINLDLKTDDDFAQAAKDVKGLKAFEDRLEQAEADFLSQMDEVDSLLKSVRELGGLSRETRLNAEKRITARKAEVRDGIVRDGIAALEVRNREFADMIGDAIKGKSSLAKMQAAVTAVVDSVNARIRANREVFSASRAEHGDAVAYGEEAFVCLNVDAAKVEMERRIERHRAALKEAELKAERDRLRREAEERLQKFTASVAELPWRSSPQPPASPQPPIEKTDMPATDETRQTAGQSAAEEMECFISVLSSAFAPARAARAELKHPENIQRAGEFATSLGVAFQTLKSTQA